jgi:hypothetical protein
MDSFLWILAWVSATFIFTESNIMERPREWLTAKTKLSLFKCCMCLGFWVGLLAHVLSPCPHLPSTLGLSHLMAGLLVSGSSYLLYKGVVQWSPAE